VEGTGDISQFIAHAAGTIEWYGVFCFHLWAALPAGDYYPPIGQ
jgi:hypothetical protein